MIIKSVNGQSTYYHYDLAGHLIAETPAGDDVTHYHHGLEND